MIHTTRTFLTLTGLILATAAMAADAPTAPADARTTTGANVSAADATILRTDKIHLKADKKMDKSIDQYVITTDGGIHITTRSNDKVDGASVTAKWTRPDLTTVNQTVITDKGGKAHGFMTTGSFGTYTLEVVSVNKPGFTYDPSSNKVTIVMKEGK